MAKVTDPATYTDQEILNHARAELVHAIKAEAYSTSERNLKKAKISDLQELIETYEARIEATNTTGGDIALARFNRQT